MKNSKLFLMIMMLLPWLTLPLLGRNAFKRYLPATIFISIITKLINVLAKKRTWWWFYERIHPKISGETVFNLGPFFVSSLWILKMTYGNFPLFLISNIMLHLFFAFPGIRFLKRFGIASLVRLNELQYASVLLCRALLLYAFQFMKEHKDIKQKESFGGS